ncbi:hypothetical protein M0R45_034271 [Rubus argutus]|uniref:AB hydrolase-1 domain-containing protein n=1 Tax=Rubus argutus TaxID=59490 RepID=A0AAW1VPQ6_RUBAR
MLATHAQPTLINSLLSSFSVSTLPLIHLTKLRYLNHRRSSARTVAAMSVSNDTAGDSPKEHVAGEWFSVPELRLRDHRFIVPLDYSADPKASSKISIFAREVVSVGKEEQPLPYLLFLQGGPGFESPRPTEAGWLEFIRVHLVPDAGPWTILGQSYGGFCAVTYLSFAPQGLKQVLLTGGIPPIGNGCTADIVYRACFEQIVCQNEKYYKRYPQDTEIVREVCKYLSESEGEGVHLPSGGILTPKGLQTLGLSGLGSSTGFERLHYMFERVWDPVIVPGAPKKISYHFLDAFEKWSSFHTNPLYARMHESIYCQGASSRWSAHRIRAEDEGKFDAVRAAKEGRPVYFTGEMIFPWIVPVAAAVYYEDMYVNFKLVMETASQIAGIRLWITNEYMHSGLRDSGSQVFDHLMGMLDGKRPLF